MPGEASPYESHTQRPAKLAARVRLFDTGHNRKTDALDAHSIAMVALRTADLVAFDAKLKNIRAELRAGVLAYGSGLMDITGVGPAGAARILADVGDVARFADRNRFASCYARPRGPGRPQSHQPTNLSLDTEGSQMSRLG